MSKTEEVIKALNAGKDTATIKAETGASDALISKCRKKLKDMEEKEQEPEPETEPEEEPTEEELESIIKKIKINPEKKFLTGQQNEPEEDYKCMGCLHEWKSKSVPVKCPKCGAEF